MTANENTPDGGHEIDGTEAELNATRRQVLAASGALATAAAGRWDELGFHPDDDEDWGELDGSVERTVLKTDEAVSASVFGKWGEFGFERGDFAQEHVSATYGPAGILLSLHASGEDSRLGASANLTPEETRELAVGLWMVAEEIEAFDDE